MSRGGAEHLREVQQEAEFERVAGSMQDFGANADGCPSCGAPARAHTLRWCMGKGLTDKAGCTFVGEHLHVICACGYFWITRKRSDPENNVLIQTPVEQIHDVLRALTAQLGAEGSLTVTKEEVALGRGGYLNIEPVEGGLKVMFVAAPQKSMLVES